MQAPDLNGGPQPDLRGAGGERSRHRDPDAGAGPGGRLGELPRTEVLGALFPVAEGRRSRLLGLALLDRDAAAPGLLIPRCRSVHTMGMRFALDVYFLGRYGEALEVRRGVPPWRFVRHRAADAVLEVPAEAL